MSKFERMKRVRNSKNLPCSFNFHRYSHRILDHRSESECHDDTNFPDSIDCASFVVETSENSFSIFNSEDGLVKIKKIASNIHRESGISDNEVLTRKNIRGKDIQKYFKHEEFQYFDSDCESV